MSAASRIAAAMTLGLLASAQAPLAQQAFHVATSLVHLPVVVLDRDHKPIRGLTRDDFEVREADRPQPVITFSEGPPGSSVPLHLGLMLDKSESMELDHRVSADAAVRFVEAMDEARDVTFVEFGESVRIGRYAPESYPQLYTRIRDTTLARQTALYDALARYIEITRERPGQHLLLIHTDGGDSGRGLSAADVRDLLRLGDVILYIVGYLENQSQADRVRQRAVLTQLARETGGEAYFASTARDIPAIYTAIRAEVAGRYTLGYQMAASEGGTRFRRVDVRLRPGVAPGATVRTRSGFVQGH